MVETSSRVGYGIAIVMLLSVSFLQWIVLLFPAWVFIVSLYVLVAEVRTTSVRA